MTEGSVLELAGELGRRLGLGVPLRLRDVDGGWWSDLFFGTVGPLLEEGVSFPSEAQPLARLEAQLAFLGANLLGRPDLPDLVDAQAVLHGDLGALQDLLELYRQVQAILAEGKENGAAGPSQPRHPRPKRSVLYSPRTELRRAKAERGRSVSKKRRSAGPALTSATASSLHRQMSEVRVRRVVLGALAASSPSQRGRSAVEIRHSQMAVRKARLTLRNQLHGARVARAAALRDARELHRRQAAVELGRDALSARAAEQLHRDLLSGHRDAEDALRHALQPPPGKHQHSRLHRLLGN